MFNVNAFLSYFDNAFLLGGLGITILLTIFPMLAGLLLGMLLALARSSGIRSAFAARGGLYLAVPRHAADRPAGDHLYRAAADRTQVRRGNLRLPGPVIERGRLSVGDHPSRLLIGSRGPARCGQGAGPERARSAVACYLAAGIPRSSCRRSATR